MHRRWQWQARTSDPQLRRSCRISDLVGGIAGAQRGAADLASRIAPSRSKVQLQNLTSGTGIATIGCTIAEPQGLPIVMNAHSGCGTHPDARIALTRALTEAAQTRLTCIQGGREDLPDLARTSGAAPAETWYNGGYSISFDDIASYQHPAINDDVEFIVERMRQFGFDQVVVPPCAPRRAADCRAPREYCEAGALQESSAIRTIVRFIRLCGCNSSAITMTFRLLDQHGRLPYRAGYLFSR
jgi:hypothetical protein